MEQVLEAPFGAELERAAVRTYTPLVHPRADRPVAILIPADPVAMQQKLCGVTVLSRLICSLDRASSGVHVVVPLDFPQDVVAEARRSVEARPTQPYARWQRSLSGIPVEHGLLVALRPMVLDHRVCAVATETTDHEHRILRFRRDGSGETLLWYVGAAQAAGFLEAVSGRADLREAVSDYLEQNVSGEIDPGAELCEVISATTPTREIEEKLFTLGRKASDTWIARVFDRRVSLWFTRRLVPFDISPNQVTVGSTAVGLLGGLLLALGAYWPQLIGAFLLTLAIIVDGCDGEIARIKYMESDFGRKLDFFLDNLVNVVSIFTVGAGHTWQGGPPVYLWASSVNAMAALGSVFPVYWLFFRGNKESVRLAAQPAATEPRRGLLSLAEDISGRDFAYLILALAVIGRAYWFSLVAIFGMTIFFFLVVGLTLARMSRPAT